MAVAYIAAIAVTVAAAAAEGYSQYKQGQQQDRLAKYNADLDAAKAVTAQNQAALDEDRQRAQGRAFQARARASAAETGFDLSGGLGDVLAQSAGDEEFDALLTRYKGKLAAQGLSADAALETWRGGVARDTATTQAGLTVAGGVAKGLTGYGEYSVLTR